MALRLAGSSSGDGCGHPLEGVAPIAQAVGPRGQYLSATTVAPLLSSKALEYAAIINGERSQRGTDFGDHGTVVTVADDPLISSSRGGLCRTLFVIRRARGHRAVIRLRLSVAC